MSLYGNTALIGAYADDDNKTEYTCLLGVDGPFTEQSKLHASDPEGDDLFGVSVSLKLIGATACTRDGQFTEQQQFLMNSDWRSVTVNPTLDLCTCSRHHLLRHGFSIVSRERAKIDDSVISIVDLYVFTRPNDPADDYLGRLQNRIRQ